MFIGVTSDHSTSHNDKTTIQSNIFALSDVMGLENYTTEI